MSRTALYRAFSENGELLYVGITGEALRRMHQHMRRSSWPDECSRIEMSYYPTRLAAEAAERAAIEAEKPKYNIIFRRVLPEPTVVPPQKSFEKPVPTAPRSFRLIRLSAVKEITGRSRSTIYADPSFPRPVKIGERAVAWVEDEIREWVDARIAHRAAA
jgi:prophage regulatory protein